jgi:hypothetical protein
MEAFSGLVQGVCAHVEDPHEHASWKNAAVYV